MKTLLRLLLSHSAAVLLIAGSVLAQPEPGPGPDPTGVVNTVEINGNVTEYSHQFFVNGYWSMWGEDGKLIGFGCLEQQAAGSIDYENHSGDGGGGQTGTYEWDGTAWNRTSSSHPDAPPLRLLPPV